MPLLIRSDGKQVDIPDANVEKALATGQFSLPPQEESAPIVDHSGNAPIPKKPIAEGPLPTEEQMNAPQTIRLPEETNQTKFVDHSAVNESFPKRAKLPDQTGTGAKKIRDIEGPRLTVINKETNEPEIVPEDDANRLVAQGTHTITDVPLIRADGKIVSIPDENIQKALQTGQFRISRQAERLSDQTEKENAARLEESGATGLKPYIGGNLDAALAGLNQHNPVNQIGSAVFGNPDVVARVEQNADQVSKSNPVGYYTGAVGGEVASAIGLGGVAGNLSKAVGLGAEGASLASRAGKIALEGTVFSAEPVIKNIVNKDPVGAAEALALGVGLNFGIHGLFSAAEAVPGIVNKITTGVAGSVAPPAVSTEEAENLIGKVIGATPADIAKNRGRFGELLKAAGITSDMSAADMVKHIQSLDESGPRIGAAIKELDTLLASEKAPIIEENVLRAKLEVQKLLPAEVRARMAAESELERLQKIVSAKENPDLKKAFEEFHDSNKEIEKYNAAGKPEAPPKVSEKLGSQAGTMAGKEAEAAGNWTEEKQAAWDEYQQRTPRSPLDKTFFPKVGEYERLLEEKMSAELKIPQLEKELAEMKMPPSAVEAEKALSPILEELSATAKKGTFEDTQALKKWLGDKTQWNSIEGVPRLRQEAYQIIKEHLSKAEDEAAEKLGANPAVAEGLTKDRQAYNFHKAFGKQAERAAAKQITEEPLQKLINSHAVHRSVPIMVAHLLGVPGPVAVAAGIAMPFAKQYFSKQGIKRAAAKLLGESATPETNTVLYALQMQEIKINSAVKETLTALVAGGAAKAPSFNDTSALKAFVPDASGQSHKNQLAILRNAVQENSDNPEALGNHVGAITADLRKEGLHQIAEEYTQHQIRLMKVLQTVLPADPKMAKAHPFAAKVDISEITPETKAKYQRALTVAADPLKLLEMVKSNTITAGDVAIAAAVNPSTLQKLRNALVEEAMKSKPDLSYQQRLSMDILMGTNLDQSTEQIPVLQDMYATPGPTAATQKRPSKGKTMDSSAQDRFNQSYLTTAQKAQGHI